MPDKDFRKKVLEIVSHIPEKRVMTYGQIAAFCGNPRAARIVGGIAHYGDPDLPWHRVVNRNGELASGYPGGKVGHSKVLEQEGFVLNKGRINLEVYLWKP